MEKSRNRNALFRRERLLKAILAASLAPFLAVSVSQGAFAQRAGSREPGLFFRPGKDSYLVTETPVYTLLIPKIYPVSVTLSPPAIPEFDLVSLEKTLVFAEGLPSTAIRLTLKARKTGVISPEPLAIAVNGVIESAFFTPVSIQADGASASPEITIHFEDTVLRQGEGAFFTVRLWNVREVTGLDWDLRPDSLLREAGAGKGTFRFEWIPLAAGALELPGFTAEVVNTAGERETVRHFGEQRKVLAKEDKKRVNSGTEKNNAEEAFIQNAFGLP
jgi:hypothetical protein